VALSIASIPGIRVGHWTDLEAATGCTVVLCEQGAVAGVDVRGAAPATRETDLLRPGSLVGRAYAILLTGGSAFGLDAAGGVMRYLEERGVGFPTRSGVVPIVPAAALFDLAIGRSDVRPDAAGGYAACQAAGIDVAEGCVGAGTGATVAKLGGAGAIKGGIGSVARELPGGILIGALVAANAVGGIYDPTTGTPIATPRTSAPGAGASDPPLPGPGGVGVGVGVRVRARENTTIGVVATNARLDAAAVNRLATLGHDGLALAVRPAHTLHDGDTLFALSVATADGPTADPVALGEAATQVVAEAIVRAVRTATPLHGIPAASA
jgi:L-aminopeptidase/D-esterase-like protein